MTKLENMVTSAPVVVKAEGAWNSSVFFPLDLDVSGFPPLGKPGKSKGQGDKGVQAVPMCFQALWGLLWVLWLSSYVCTCIALPFRLS